MSEISPGPQFARISGLPTTREPGSRGDGTAVYDRPTYTLAADTHVIDDAGNLIRLMKVSEDAPGISIVNAQTGASRTIELETGEGVAAESHVVLLPRNIVAVLENGQSAPGRGHVQDYLRDKLGLKAMELEVIHPKDRLSAIGDEAIEVSRVRARVPARAADLEEVERGKVRGLFARWRHQLNTEVSRNIKMEVVLSVAKEGGAGDRAALKEISEAIISEDQAEILKLDYGKVQETHQRNVDMMKDLLTSQVEVVLTDVGDNEHEALLFVPESTALKIREAYGELRDQLFAGLDSMHQGGHDVVDPWWRPWTAGGVETQGHSDGDDDD